MGDRTVVAFTVALFATTSLAGCATSGPEPSAAAVHCSSTSVPLVNLPTASTGEPVMALPKPQGWTYSPERNSTSIRGAIVNSGLQANDFTPSFVVSLADVTADSSTPQEALDFERAGYAEQVGAIDTDIPGVLCGYPSKTITYTIQGRHGSTLIVAAKDSRNKVWVAKVSTQTTKPNDPDYQTAQHDVFSGFQISLPSN